jgi:hypothetical protein
VVEEDLMYAVVFHAGDKGSQCSIRIMRKFDSTRKTPPPKGMKFDLPLSAKFKIFRFNSLSSLQSWTPSRSVQLYWTKKFWTSWEK